MIKTNNTQKGKVQYRSRIGHLMNEKFTNIPLENKKGYSLNQTKGKRLLLESTNPVSSIITHNQRKPSLSSYDSFLCLSSTNSLNKDKLLFDKQPQYINKKTLVIDLDETLVHSWFQSFSPSDIIIQIEFEKKVVDIHVLVRPGVKEFFIKMSKCFELVIFTASLSKYASPLLDILDSNKLCSHRLYREHCTKVNGVFVKDLQRLNRDLKDIIILDNSPLSFAFNPENGFPIKSWYENKNDKELYVISPILEFLSTVNDVRVFIPKIISNDILSLSKANELIGALQSNHKIKQAKQKVTLRRKKPSESSMNSNNFKETNINIITNNNRLNFFFNSNLMREPQTSKSINMPHTTHLITLKAPQTSKNKDNCINQSIERVLLNPHNNRKTNILSNYSSLLDYKEQDLNGLNIQISNRTKRPISSLINQLSLRKPNDYNEIARTPLRKLPSQDIELSSQHKLSPSSSYSTLYPTVSLIKNNANILGSNDRQVKSKRCNSRHILTPNSTSIDSYQKRKLSIKKRSNKINNQDNGEITFQKRLFNKKKIKIV